MTTTPNPSEEQIEKAARAIRADYVQRYPEEPPVYHAGAGQPVWRHMARAALVAAGVAPQEPNQTETKAGNNFVSLDPEKVAALIESERDRAAAERDFAQESLGQFMAPALCEAAKRGELSQVNPVAISPERVKNVGDSLHVAPELVIDEAALAEVIGKVTDLWDEPLDEVHDIPQIARAVAQWFKDGAK